MNDELDKRILAFLRSYSEKPTKTHPVIDRLFDVVDKSMDYTDGKNLMFDEVLRSADSLSTRFEYCKGKNLLPRGYYHPSKIRTHIVDNENTGQLSENVSKLTKNYLKYGFDEKDNLCAVYQYERGHLQSVEIIEYFAGISYGIKMTPTLPMPEEVSAVGYDEKNRPAYYFVRSPGAFSGFPVEYEEYAYSPEGFIKEAYVVYGSYPDILPLQYYEFDRQMDIVSYKKI